MLMIYFLRQDLRALNPESITETIPQIFLKAFFVCLFTVTYGKYTEKCIKHKCTAGGIIKKRTPVSSSQVKKLNFARSPILPCPDHNTFLHP